MEHIRSFREIFSPKYTIPKELLIELTFFILCIPALVIINKSNNLLFHGLVELFSCIAFFLIFVFAYSTYNISKNNFLMLLGIGYCFVAFIDVLHLFSYPGVSILFPYGNKEVTAEIWITARYIGAFTCLVSTTFLFKPIKTLNIYVIFWIYFLITNLFLLSIFYTKTFPICFNKNNNLSHFKIISEYIVSSIYIIVAYIFFKLRKNIDSTLFFYLECFLLISVLSELLFTSFFSPQDWTAVTGHILKIIASYCLFKGVVEVGLKSPFSIIFNDLNKADNKIKEFEEILIKNEECYDMVINNSDNAILVINDNKFVYANKRAAHLLCTDSVDNIINQHIVKVIPEEVKPLSLKRINNTLSKQNINHFIETKLLRFDGKVIDVEVINCYCAYHGKPAVIAMFRDISAKKQIKQLENDIVEHKLTIAKTRELNKTLTEFFSNVSHELKTPLNVILGAIQILALPVDDLTSVSYELKLKKYLKTMKQNCYRLLRIVNNIIDLSKFDSGYLKLNLKNHDIVHVVEDISLSVADYVENKGLELIFDTEIEEKIMAFDADKIERIILNLLSNSVKFTNEGGKIFVNILDKEASIVISIKDTGIGIPEDKIDIIFERFGQVDKTLSRNNEGSGIGLSLVKSIVDMHGGSIRVLSNLGEGSEFLIELPVKLVDEELIYENHIYDNKIEKISIEFSDIYS